MDKIKRSGAIIIILIAAFAICLISAGRVYAGNGTRMLGFSARDSGMAGATTASPEDTSCLVKNPAGLVWIGNKIDLEYLNILPHNVTMDTEGPDVAALGGQPFVNRGLKQGSTIDYIPGANGGVSYRIPGTDEHPIAVGCGAFTIAGVAVNFPSSRINTLFTGDYDKMADIRSLRVAPGLAAAFNDKFSFGATANIEIQGLRTNLATTNISAFHYVETAGGGKWDFVPGGGFTLGLLYKFSDMLNLGASYESHTWMGHHYRYKDVMPLVDEPPVINAGISLKPTKNFEWTIDARYINWTDVKILRDTPARGGFGWGDQWVFATGGEYTFKDKKNNDLLKVRLGYNYGKSPVQASVIFANAVLPLIVEHHLTVGLSYFIKKDLSLDIVWEHHFFNVMSDNGAGDIYSVNGDGTKITAAGELIGVGLGYKF